MKSKAKLPKIKAHYAIRGFKPHITLCYVQHIYIVTLLLVNCYCVSTTALSICTSTRNNLQFLLYFLHFFFFTVIIRDILYKEL
jgi:hypothetical protein